MAILLNLLLNLVYWFLFAWELLLFMIMQYIFFLMFRNIQYHASIILYSISWKTDSRLRGEGAFVDIFSDWLFLNARQLPVTMSDYV